MPGASQTHDGAEGSPQRLTWLSPLLGHGQSLTYQIGPSPACRTSRCKLNFTAIPGRSNLSCSRLNCGLKPNNHMGCRFSPFCVLRSEITFFVLLGPFLIYPLMALLFSFFVHSMPGRPNADQSSVMRHSLIVHELALLTLL